MGEARRRGTFEERKSQAIERNAREAEERNAAFKAKMAALTPEERRKRMNNLALFLGLSSWVDFAAMGQPTPPHLTPEAGGAE